MSKFGNLMQGFFMGNPRRAMWFLSTMPVSFWEKQGQKKALQLFREATDKTSAYKDFLKKHNLQPDEIQTFADFKTKVPITDKKNYIYNYDLRSVSLDALPNTYTFVTSSGSTATPSFWPRIAVQDRMIPRYFELLYLQSWSIDRYATLVIIATALGWSAASICDWNLKQVAATNKYRLTIASPGADVHQIIEIIKKMGSHYEQIIMITYPSFLRSLLDEGERQEIRWQEYNVKLWTGGEPVEHAWREAISKRLGIKENDWTGITEVYGVSDAAGTGTVGFGSPMTGLIRKLAAENKSLLKDLFDAEHLPSLVQYNPMGYFVEIVEGEIVVTSGGGIPLIRYNIHDRGGVIPFDQMMESLKSHDYDPLALCREHGYSPNKIWKWPFVYTFGRSDNVVSIGGANVYPQNIEAALHTKETEGIHSFKLMVRTGKGGEMRLHILVELKRNLEISEELKIKYHNIILNKLLEVNADYRKSYEDDMVSADPVIELYLFGTGPFSDKRVKTKRLYIHKEDA